MCVGQSLCLADCWTCRPERPLPAFGCLHLAQGVGPATASAILEAYNPSIPFLSDEAQQAALGSKDYTGADPGVEEDVGAGPKAFARPCAALCREICRHGQKHAAHSRQPALVPPGASCPVQ